MDYKIKKFRNAKTHTYCSKCHRDMTDQRGIIKTWHESKRLKNGNIRQIKRHNVICLNCVMKVYEKYNGLSLIDKIKRFFTKK